MLLILLPLGWRLTTRALTARGDTSAARHAVVLEHFTADDIEAGRDYSRAFQPGGAAATLIYWGLLGWLLLGGLPRRLADHAARLSRGHLLLELLLVGVPLFLLLRLALLPVSIYHGYVLEGQFDFRRLDLIPWLWRLFKGWGVAGITQLVMGLGFFWLVRRFGDRWIWPTVLGGTLFSYLYIVLWPLVVLPLFYEITPVPPGELRHGIAELATRAGVEVDEIRLVDQSRVSGHANAFFVGIGKRRSIYLYDTLTEDHSVPETLAVVAHEIGHWRHRHMLLGWALGVAGITIGLFLLRWFGRLAVVRRTFRVHGLGDLAIIPLLWTLSGVAGMATAPIEGGISRHFERQADLASLELTGDPATFIEMKTSMARQNRSNLLPHPLVVFWYASHPPVIDRILAAEDFQASRPGGKP